MGDEASSSGDNEDTPTFGEQFTALAANLRPDGGRPWNNEEIASRLGISQPYVQQLKSGRKANPSLALAVDIARLYGVSVGQLAGEADALSPEDLRLLNAVRTPELRDLVAKLDGIGPQARQVIARLIDEVGALDRDSNR